MGVAESVASRPWAEGVAVLALELGGLGDVPADALVDLARSFEQTASWAMAAQLAVMDELCRRPLLPGAAAGSGAADVTAVEVSTAELAAALQLGPRAAANRMDLATRLRQDLPATWAALRAGRIDLGRARVIADDLGGAALEPDVRAQVERIVLATAPERTAAQVRADLRRALQAVDPSAAAARHARARRSRCIRFAPAADAMGHVWGLLPAEGMAIADTTLDALADLLSDQDTTARPGTTDVFGIVRDEEHPAQAARTHDERRADAFVGVFAAILSGQALPVLTRPASEGTTDATGEARDDEPLGVGSFDLAGSTAAPPAAGAAPPARAARPSGAGPEPGTAPAPGASPSGVSSPGGAPGHPAGGRPSHALVGWWTPPALPTRNGRRPHLIVTVPLATLLAADPAGEDDTGTGPPGAQGTTPTEAGGPCGASPPPTSASPAPDPPLPGVADGAELAGYGPIPSALARRLARDAGTYQIAGIDEHGRCAHLGARGRYRPLAVMIDQITVRDPHCRHPGCRRPAVRCDIDHVRPYADGGPTCPCNLQPLCRRHHRLKTHARWRCAYEPDGSVIWTSPLGRRHVDLPHRYLVPPDSSSE